MGFIDISNVHRSFGKIKAVDNVSLQVEKGEVFGLLGPNGAGKSTLISMIATILDQDSGKITVSGYDTKAAPKQVKTRIGLVPQEIALYPSLTAGENLAFWGKMYGLPKSKLKEKVDMALDIAGLKERQKDRIETYSGGMKRRLDIAMSLLGTPSVIFLDEPTTGLDPKSRISMWKMIKEFASIGVTIFLTTQYLEEAEYLADRIAILHDGKIVIEGSVSEIKQMIPNVFIILHLINESEKLKTLNIYKNRNAEIIQGTNHVKVESDGTTVDILDILKKLESNDIVASSFEQKKPTLENVFLKIVNNEV